MSTQQTLRTSNLRKRFGNLVAVDGVSIELEEGEFFSLLGPSGCGKTTTLRMISGLEGPTSGEIYLDGEPVTNQSSNKRNVNLVFQDLVLFPHMSVFENIAYGPKRAGMGEEKIEPKVTEMLEMVELPGYADRDISELSGGEQQRVCLARALINEPKVLLLDEPLSSLDRKLKKQMQFELKNIQRKFDTTFLYVTHDQDSAMSMSDRMAVMNQGEIAEIGEPDELYNNPKTEFVADFLGDANIFTSEVMKNNGSKAVVQMANQYKGDAILDGVEDITKGEPTNVMVRPEDVHIDSPTDRSELIGTVESKTYKGFYTEFEVKVGDQSIKVRQEEADDSFNREDNVEITFDRMKVVD
jgi:spermidine/putrescine transport system ATP-binding protein